MLKLTTKIALAALLSISALSTAEASRRTYDHDMRDLGGEQRGYNNVQRVQRNNGGPVAHTPHRTDGEYSLSRDDIYGQPPHSGSKGGYLDYAEEPFSDKAKRFVSNHKKEILIGTAILTAVVGTVSYFMSMGQNEEEQNPSYHPGVVHDPVLDIAADIAAKAAREAAEYAAYQARMGLNMVGSPETAVTVWEEPTVFTAVVNTASHWLSGFTRQFYGS